jgi:hypothetical protein
MALRGGLLLEPYTYVQLLGQLRIEIRIRRPTTLGHQKILRGIDGDAIKPGVEGALRPEAGQGPVGLDKGLLGDIQRLGGL